MFSFFKGKAVLVGFYFLFLLLISNTLLAFQSQKTVKLSSIYNDLITSNQSDLYYEQMYLIDDITDPITPDKETDFIKRLEKILGKKVPTDSLGILTQVDRILFNRITSEFINLEKVHLNGLDLLDSKIETLDFNELKIDSVVLDSVNISAKFTIRDSHFGEYSDSRNVYQRYEIYNTVFRKHYLITQTVLKGEFWVFDCTFEEGAYIGPMYNATFGDFTMEGCIFEPIDSSIPVLMEDLSPDSLVFKTQAYFNLFGEIYQFNVSDTDFQSNGDEQYIFIEGGFEYMGFEGNNVASQFFPQATVTKQLTMSENEFTGNVMLAELILGGQNNHVNWEEIQGFKMGKGQVWETLLVNTEISGLDIPEELVNPLFQQTGDLVITTYRGLTDEEYEDQEAFQELISSYYRLYKIYKENGQIQDANHVYVEMKDVQLRQLAYMNKTYGGLENWIQWRLNGLLKFYTDHGTNPAKAIRISIFVVLLFSIFYFFFPSEWDTKSKKQLLADYRLFIEKNDHGYFKPFMKLLWGFFKSLVNAITLSLNSFVTLGFGTIPTTGLARYVCIIQGFLGWFLLSVFTASLINQVMF